MPLIKIIRHGFEFWEAPPCKNPPLPELEQSESGLRSILAKTEYRRRQPRDTDEQTLSLMPAAPSDIVKIQTAVIDAFEITSDEFYGRARTEKVAKARIASLALCRVYTRRTIEEIGEAHNRHYRLVIHACYRLGEIQRIDSNFAAAVTRIETFLLQQGGEPWKN